MLHRLGPLFLRSLRFHAVPAAAATLRAIELLRSIYDSGVIAVGEALSHADPFVPQSVLWSLGVIALAGYALGHGWYFSGDALLFHLSRAAWFGWIASEVFNVWLNLRGIGRRRYARRREDAAPMPEPRFRRRRRLEWVEEVEGRGVAADEFARHLGPNLRADLPPAVGQPVPVPVPQVVYLKDENGNFVPVPLPRDDAVPANHRLR